MRISVHLFGVSNTCSFLFITSFVRGYEQHSQKNRPVIYFANIDITFSQGHFISLFVTVVVKAYGYPFFSRSDDSDLV